jgi:hypothetical protein
MIMALVLSVVLLEARYTPVPDSNPEYAQGAIEKCDLRHGRVADLVWVIEVSAPADIGEWQKRLNDAVEPKHGRFAVARATPEEEEMVRSGRIVLQR